MSNMRSFQMIAKNVTLIPTSVPEYISIPECQRVVVHVAYEVSGGANFLDVGFFIRESPNVVNNETYFSRTPLRVTSLLRLNTVKAASFTYTIDNPSQYLQLVFSRFSTTPGQTLTANIALEFLD